MWPTLWEIDEAEPLYPWAPYEPFDGIGTLSSWFVSAPLKSDGGKGSVPFVIYADGPNADDADYYYYLYYRFCHLETEPVCQNP